MIDIKTCTEKELDEFFYDLDIDIQYEILSNNGLNDDELDNMFYDTSWQYGYGAEYDILVLLQDTWENYNTFNQKLEYLTPYIQKLNNTKNITENYMKRNFKGAQFVRTKKRMNENRNKFISRNRRVNENLIEDLTEDFKKELVKIIPDIFNIVKYIRFSKEGNKYNSIDFILNSGGAPMYITIDDFDTLTLLHNMSHAIKLVNDVNIQKENEIKTELAYKFCHNMDLIDLIYNTFDDINKN